uniref:Sema domain-containing protein n=1 Tax=Setaria viridis TaxID=4556 RepID=A0A4U6TP60_SETVI|nr:hypothetical protein SEVIR_8G032950v2 [Setaria viridis]
MLRFYNLFVLIFLEASCTRFPLYICVRETSAKFHSP